MSKIELVFGEENTNNVDLNVFAGESMKIEIATQNIYDNVIKTAISTDINNIIQQREDGIYATINTPDDISSFIHKLDNIIT